MFKFCRKNKVLGFTLIELLVVVSLIGLLTTMAVIALNSSRKKTRNLRRNADAIQLAKAFQLAADNNGGQYPASGFGSACISDVCTGVFSGFPSAPAVNSFFAPYTQRPSDSNQLGRVGTGFVYSSPNLWYRNLPGTYISWSLEPTNNIPGVCGAGTAAQDFMPNMLLCYLKID